MKGKILKFILVIGIVFTGVFQTQAQSALNVQGGWSWSEGIVSAGYQYGTVEAKVGLMVAPMPGSGDKVSGPTVTLIWGPEWDESGYYLSYTYNSVGYRS